MSRHTLNALAGAGLVAAAITAAPPANATIQSIGGQVTCINFWQQASQPVGVWVDYDNKKGGWAQLKAGDQFWRKWMWYSAPDVRTFHLHIGCGGDSRNWGTTVYKDMPPQLWQGQLEARY
jgi:hypothetical protein